MTTTILKRDVFHVTGDMESNRDAMRVLCDIGQDICAAWATYDTPEQNLRTNEQMFILLNTLQSNLKIYDSLVTEAAHLAKAKA